MTLGRNLAWLAFSVSGLALSFSATSAAAQVLPPGEPSNPAATDPLAGPTTPPVDAPATSTAEDGEAIVVTGTRISRPDYVANSPAVTIGQDAIQSSGQATIEAALNQLPQFTPSFGAASAFPGNGGQANINLRGLGTNRALVLLDGRRLQPSNPDGTIDLNIIPDMLVSGVETLTGGASAAYGSDAIAGVVNFKIRRDVDGIEIDLQDGITERGDARNSRLTLIGGTKFGGDRGSIVASLTYTSRDGLLRGARDFFRTSQLLTQIPQGTTSLASNPPSQAAVDQVFGRYGAAPGRVGRGQTFGFNTDGTLFTAAAATFPIVNFRDPQDETVLARNNVVFLNTGPLFTLQLPIERYAAYGFADYDLTDTLNVFAEVNYSTYTARRQLSAANLGGLGTAFFVPASNPFVPADLRTLLNSRAQPNAPIQVVKNAAVIGNRRFKDKYDVLQVTLGASGALPIESWTWNGYYSFGRTNYDQTLENSLSLPAVQQLVNAPDGGVGLCAGGFNPFGNQPLSAACQDFVRRTLRNSTRLRQQTAELNAQGNLFDLPAGSVKLAIGAAYRRNTYDFAPDALLAAGGVAGFTRSAPASGKDKVGELYAELFVPLLKDAPFAKEVNVSAAYRYSRYDISGSVSTYKVDGDWSVVDGLRFRGGYQRAVRAPSLSDLFASPIALSVNIGSAISSSGAPSFTGDPCDIRSAFRSGSSAAQVRTLCLAQGVPASAIDSFTRGSTAVNGINAGNLGLKPESADTYSFGGVIQPKFLPSVFSRLSLSLDYYSISIKDAIGVLSAGNQLSRCFNGDNASNTGFSNANSNCTSLTRDASGQLVEIAQPLLNQATFKTSGVDLQVDWRIPFASTVDGVRLNTVVSYVKEFKVTSFAGSPTLDYAGTVGTSINGNSIPDWRATTTVAYYNGPSELSLRWRYINKLTDVSRVANAASIVPGVPAYSYFDLNGRIGVTDKFVLRAGVVNLLDKDPPTVGGVAGDTEFTLYDTLGRQFYVGVSAKF